jgi:hypothetical protein
MFNTLKYAKMLQQVGFSKDQAETSVGILVDIMEEKLATKEDLQILKAELKADLTVRMGTMLAASIAILTALLKFI